MSQSQSILVSALACSTLLLSGALSHQDALPARIPPSLFKPQSAPSDARPLLEELSQRQVDWLTATVWQKMCDGENSFEAMGTLHRGPQNRFRLEMDIKAQAPARLLIVSDGTTSRQWLRVGPETPVAPWHAPKGETRATVIETQLQDQTPADLPALLKHLREGLREASVQGGLWQDLPVLRIVGKWTPREDTPKELRPPVQPRTCHLYLDARTHWPVRLEWWDSDSLLLQMEFRDLAVNQPLSADEAARLFSCPPATK